MGLKEEYLALLDGLVICGVPQNGLLDCLTLSSKETLLDIGIRYGVYDEDGEMETEELCDMLQSLIIEAFEKNAEHKDMSELEMLLEIQDKAFSLDDITNIGLVREFLADHYIGWVYYFLDQDQNEIYVNMPTELREAAATLLRDESKVAAINKKQNLDMSVKALLNLYGLCEKEQLCKVFENLFHEQIEPQELDDFLQETATETDLFEIKGDWLVVKGMLEDEEYDLLIELIKERPYYMPTAEDVEKYQWESVDLGSEPYYNLKEYLAGKLTDTNQLDYLLFELGMCCTGDVSPEEAIMAANAFAIEFDHVGDLNKFARLYCDLRDHSPSWLLRGYTPQQAGTAETFRSVALPPGTKVKAKVGRNDPCPCGSGKKYKKCCGR